jgi:hypothetical protein
MLTAQALKLRSSVGPMLQQSLVGLTRLTGLDLRACEWQETTTGLGQLSSLKSLSIRGVDWCVAAGHAPSL